MKLGRECLINRERLLTEIHWDIHIRVKQYISNAWSNINVKSRLKIATTLSRVSPRQTNFTTFLPRLDRGQYAPMKWPLFACRQCLLLSAERRSQSREAALLSLDSVQETRYPVRQRPSSLTVYRYIRFYVARQNYWNHNVNQRGRGSVSVLLLFGRGNYPASLVFIPWEVKKSIKPAILFSKFTFGTYPA